MTAPPTPDCMPFFENADFVMARLPSHRDVELLLSDGMFDEIGRVLDDFPDGHPLSLCPSPRTDSPWPFLVPVLSSSSSSSTLLSNVDGQGAALTRKPRLQHKPSLLRNTLERETSQSATSWSTESESSLEVPVKKAKASKKRRQASEDMDEVPVPKSPTKKKAKPSSPAFKEPADLAAQNERSRKSSSTYRGVSLCTKDSRWQARIRIRKEVVYLGRFETEEAAARRYDDAAREHHGDKALINFITPEDRALGRRSVFEQAGGKSARA